MRSPTSGDHRPEAGGDQAKKSIANFKIRTGMPIGQVTLGAPACTSSSTAWSTWRSAGPRLQGRVPKSFDGRGNYALGLKERVIFPEIVYDKIDKVRGMDVIVCTTARTDERPRRS
jgi:large subunit ribosomal protein L5